MSAKHKHRNRIPPLSAAGNQRPQGPGPRRRIGRKVGLVVGLGVLGVAVWFAAGHGRHAETQPQVLPAAEAPLPAGRDGSTPSAARGAGKASVQADVNRASELLAQGETDQAVEMLTAAARTNPQNEDIHYNLGLALTRQGKPEEAMKQYEEALRLFPNYVEAHNNLGNLLMRAKRTTEAIQHFEQAVKIMPDYASAHNNLGTALQQTGQTSEALAQFQLAVKANPDYWEAHFNLGTSFLRERRQDQASAEFETVLRLHPDFKPAKVLLARIEGRGSGNAPPKP